MMKKNLSQFIRSPQELAQQVASQRKKLKMSQSAVGQLVGIKQATLSAFENKPESTKLETLFQILSGVNLELYVVSKEGKSGSSTEWPHEW